MFHNATSFAALAAVAIPSNQRLEATEWARARALCVYVTSSATRGLLDLHEAISSVVLKDLLPVDLLGTVAGAMEATVVCEGRTSHRRWNHFVHEVAMVSKIIDHDTPKKLCIAFTTTDSAGQIAMWGT